MRKVKQNTSQECAQSIMKRRLWYYALLKLKRLCCKKILRSRS